MLQTLSAIRKVESTGQVVPFNGLGGVYGRQRDRGALEPPHRGIDGNYHFSTTYGDGTEIPREYLDKLLEISDDIGFLVPWQEGDVALIDNYTVQVGPPVDLHLRLESFIQAMLTEDLACTFSMGWQALAVGELVGWT